MANKIQLEITGDQTLEKNVKDARKIKEYITGAYENWRKLSADNKASASAKKTADELKKLAQESKKVNKEISKQTAEQKKLERIQNEYNATLKKSNQIQTSYATDLQKTNAQIEVLKKNQKLLTAQGKQTTAEYIRNKTAIKDLTSQYRQLEKTQLQDIQAKRTIESLGNKQNLTLQQQKQLFSALNIQYNKLVTEEGKASKATLALQQRMEKLNASILESERRVKLHQRNVGNYPQAFGKVIKSGNGMVIALAAIGMAVSRAISQVQKYVDMANKQEVVEKKLSTVMKQRMGTTDAGVKSMIEYAGALQKTGVLGDEVILSGASQLATFVKQEESLKTLVPAMNDLAVSTYGTNVSQQQLQQTANLFGKVMDGQTSALTRVGVSLTDYQKELLKSGDEMQKASVLAEVIRQNVGNMNEALAETDAGKLQQARNELGDLGEELGAVLLPALASFLKALLDVAKGIKSVAQTLGLLKDETSDLTVAQQRQQSINDELNKTISDEKARISELLVVAKNDKRSKEERLTAIKTLNSISPEYLGTITLENIETAKTTATIEKYIDALERKVKAQLAQEKLSEIYGEIYEAEVALTEAQLKFSENTNAYYESLIKNGLNAGKTINDLRQEFGAVGDLAGLTALDAYQNFVTGQEILTNALNGLNTEKDEYLKTLDEMGVSFGGLTNGANNLTGANQDLATSYKDIFAIEKERVNAEILQKEIDLRYQYQDDVESIEKELLQFKEKKQKELYDFVIDNNISKEKLNQEKVYLDAQKANYDFEIEMEQKKYNNLYSDYQDYMTKKQLENDKYILGLEKSGAEESEIEFQKLQDQKELYTNYLTFLQQNANEQNEIERLQLQNQLLDVENQLSKLKESVVNEDETIRKALGLTPENIEGIKEELLNLAEIYNNFLADKYNNEVEYYENRRKLLADDIKADEERIKSLRDGLMQENELRDKNLANTALLTESQIRDSQLRIETKRKEQQELLSQQQESANKLKAVQKRQIYAQFAFDTASAISSLTKIAFASSANVILAGIQIVAGTAQILASFAKARASVRGLKDGEVDIQGSGTETSDSIPANLSKGESVIKAKGTKKAKNFLTGLNSDASDKELLRLLAVDFGQKALHENNIIVNFDSYELKEQNQKLQRQIEETEKNNVYLSRLLKVTENKADYISLPNGYKKITRNGETIIRYE